MKKPFLLINFAEAMSMRIPIFFLMMIALLVESCQTKQLQKNKMTKATERLAYNDSLLLSKRNAGIDFFANGYHPIPWTLEMDYDHAFVFNAENGINFSGAPTAGRSNQEKKAEIYNTQGYDAIGPAGAMEISIYQEKCNQAPEKNKVTVIASDTVFEGCGAYLYNEQLNNRWLLQEIDDRYPDLGDFPNGLPEMTLDLSKNRMYGFDGCNSMSTSISIRGDRIQFGTIQSTLKACEGVKTELVKWKLIDKQLVEYRFRIKELVLYLIDDSRLTFKPIY